MRVEQRAVDHEGALALALQLWLFLRPGSAIRIKGEDGDGSGLWAGIHVAQCTIYA